MHFFTPNDIAPLFPAHPGPEHKEVGIEAQGKVKQAEK